MDKTLGTLMDSVHLRLELIENELNRLRDFRKKGKVTHNNHVEPDKNTPNPLDEDGFKEIRAITSKIRGDSDEKSI